MTAIETHRAIEGTFRIERARLIGGLARVVRDIDRAEELAQEALLIALAEWPRTGVPAKPGAWLMTAAKRRAIDGFRRDRMLAGKHEELARELGAAPVDPFAEVEAAIDDDLGDELLGLIFAACHPLLSSDARAALTLRVVGGLTTDEIARAFLTSEATIAQRIVRAKKTISAGVERGVITFEVPRGSERVTRLPSVLEVVYLIFNEGYAATAGDHLVRPDLCLEAVRLARILAALLAREPEVFGLLSLLELQASRLSARTGQDGSFIPLAQQQRSRWDQLLIGRGLKALLRAEALGGGGGPYALQAALAACHARSRTAADTDWVRICALYDQLRGVLPSPVVDLNRAIAHSMAFGPDAGLALLEEIAASGALTGYAPLPAARGDFLFRAGRFDEAREQFTAAARMTRNEREAAFLKGRAQVCDCAATTTPSEASKPASSGGDFEENPRSPGCHA